jgi:N-acyl-D-amino-acid deacylase
MGQAARPPIKEELSVMKAELAKALEQGARGLSSGLTYAPGRFSEVEELVELGKVVRRHNGIYHTHLRDYTRFLIEALGEAIRVGEEAGIPVNVSHMYPAAPPYWGEMAYEATALFEAARERGVEATFDITPWTRGGGPYMQSLPDWAQEGGVAALKQRLEDPATRQEIARQLEEGAPDWKGWLPIDWEDQLIARTGREENEAWAGRTIADLAEERGLPPAETALILLLEDDGQFWVAGTIKSQDDINHILSHPLGVPITDGFALAPYGPLHHPTMPRSYGTFPRVLGQYAREWGVVSQESAVQKLTSMPALRAGITDRGLLRPGLYADITVFDPETVIDRETYDDPHAFPAGIEYVLVNGQLVVERGIQHVIRPGQVL